MPAGHVGVSKSPSRIPVGTCSTNAAPIGVGEDYEHEYLAALVCLLGRDKYFH